jgi:hypothetical protein
MPDITIYRPRPREFAALATVAAVSLGVAAYMRYGLVEPSTVGLVCDAGAATAVCVIRRVFIVTFEFYGFGVAALIATFAALWRPTTFKVSGALAVGLLGVVLYNTQLSGLALALLPLVLARPAPEPRQA